MLPLSKAKLKFFASLQQKKFRNQAGLFLGEGWKLLQEAVEAGWPIEAVVVEARKDFLLRDRVSASLLFECGSRDFGRLCSQVNPEGVVTVLRMPVVSGEAIGSAFLLEGVQDPGNLGTLVRTADWFGVPQLICSPGTVDVYNPKVVRAAMGSIFRIQVAYREDFQGFVQENATRIWVADMEGEPLPAVSLRERDFILLGNEARGVSEAVRSLPGLGRVTIPRLGGAESLNVGIAAGVLAAAWRLG